MNLLQLHSVFRLTTDEHMDENGGYLFNYAYLYKYLQIPLLKLINHHRHY
jgi:hypothetical protein